MRIQQQEKEFYEKLSKPREEIDGLAVLVMQHKNILLQNADNDLTQQDIVADSFETNEYKLSEPMIIQGAENQNELETDAIDQPLQSMGRSSSPSSKRLRTE